MAYKDIAGRPRSSAGFAQVGKYVYWAAGHLGQFHYYGRCHFSREVHRLDLENDDNDWERLADFPVPAQGFRMCGYEDFVYAFGGFVYEGDGEWPVRSSDVVRRYDRKRNLWEDVGTLTSPRSSNVLGKIGNLVYLIGGWNGSSKPGPDESEPWRSKPGAFHDTIEIFDLATNKTADVIPLGIEPRRAFTAVTVGEDITIACGLGPKNFADLKTEVMTFSTKQRLWTKLFDTPLGLFAPGLTRPGHAPLVVGGLFVTLDYTQYQEFDSISTFYPHGGNRWIEVAKLSSTRTFAECAIWNDRLIILGGHSGLWPVSTVETLDASNPGKKQKQSRLSVLASVV